MNSKGSRSTLVRRLALVFVANLALFAITLGVVLHATARLDIADAEVARFDRAKDHGHRVSALVREQYIHQAHTIIEGNRSHLGHYEDVARATRDAVAALERVVEEPADRVEVEAIASLVRKNDEEFRTATVPAIDRESANQVRELHARTEAVVVDALSRIGALNARFERRTVDARARADILRRRTRSTAAACFLLATFVAALAAVLTTRWLALRVTLLREGTRAIGAGDLRARIGLGGKDEFAEIARGIDDMAASLERHHEEVLRAHRLASIGQVAAGVAHEINNPLGVILGFVKTMRRTERRDDEGLDVIEAEAKQCKRIVEGLLDLARPQPLVVERVDVVKLLAECVERLRSGDRLNGVTVAGLSAPAVTVTADPGRLRQVFLNVLANAAEAVRPSGHVSIAAQMKDGRAEIVVSDDGPGIPEKIRERLFQPFVTTKDGGVGLGLAIASAIVDAHSGTIRCESGSAGTRVHIMLPLIVDERAA